MSVDEQRIAIAEACGWVKVKAIHCGGMLWKTPDGGLHLGCPNYLADLNDMHEAEKAIEPCDWPEYAMQLRRVIQRDCNKPECYVLGADRSQLIADFWFYHATAAQRAEAFLRTIGKFTS